MTTSYPLSWPDGWARTSAAARKGSRFDTPYLAACDNLLNELRLLGAGSVIVSSNAPLRRDGKPYTEAMNDHLDDPGVAVYFQMKDGPRVMARDAYLTPAENLHAIGHVIGHLRGMTRHGGAAMMARAFSGFAALPAPKHWSDILGVTSQATAEQVTSAYRAKAPAAHPDSGGSTAAMAELNAARAAALKEIGG